MSETVSGPISSNPTPNDERLLRQWFDFEERERHWVACEIHDGFVQQATAALLHLQAFRDLYARNPHEAQKTLDAAIWSLEEGIREARRLMAGLQPAMLDESGVVAAIDELARQRDRRGGPKIEFSHAVQFDRLEPLVETAIFRIVQESLANACRHSRSEKVQIRLAQAGDRVHLEIQDWGIGFDPASIDKARFGLRGIRERASMLGGRAAIETSPGKGTRVIVELPLGEAAGNEGPGAGSG